MTSKEAEEFIGKKIAQLQREGVPKRQSIAIAFDEARRKGYKVPARPGSHVRRAERMP